MIDGFVADGYESVRAAFETDLRGGSALAVLRDGDVVVDLREGWRDAARTVPWDADTVVNVYSVGKPVIAYAVMLLVRRGVLALEDSFERYWPSFRAPITVRQAMTHTAGLPIFPVERPPAAWADWDQLCDDLAGAEPLWAPGTVAAEHALTYGHLLGELVRRVDGRTPARFVTEEIAGPLGAAFGFGLRDTSRCAELEFDAPDRPARVVGEPGSMHARALSNPAGALDLAVVNSDLWRTASIPAVNLHATAMAVARFYANPSTAALAVREFEGFDRVIEQEVPWGLGVQFEPDGSWGMGGLGGNAGWFDPARGLAVGYVTRRLGGFDAVDRIEAALQKP
jgi:CubicO group peptidase (beta-lactamase class C family)